MAISQGSRATRRHTTQHPPLRQVPAALPLSLIVAGAVVVLWLWWQNTTAVVGLAGWLAGAGRITGLLAGYGAAVLIALMARVPLLERGVGSDRVARWHAMGGRYVVSLVVAHIGLTIWAYAEQAHSGVMAQVASVVLGYPDMLKATAGTLLLLGVAFASIRAVRARIGYDTWYYLHLLTYVAIFLAFWHQLAVGSEFAGNPKARAGWYVLYGSVVALVVWHRILTPARLNVRHQLRVEATVQETPNVVSVWIRGKHLHRLRALPGQFFRWRFMTKDLWWSANPYSLSAPPRRELVRITVKAVGAHSAALAELRPGTRVWAEGPYGSLTAARSTRAKVLLLAGGVGITPLRALFETVPARAGKLTLLYRASTTEELALREELEEIAAARGAQIFYAVNGRDGSRAEITSAGLRAMLPDIARHDVYLCGPPGMAEESYGALREVGVPARHIHYESFEL